MPFHPKQILLHPKVVNQFQRNPLYLRAITQFLNDPLPGSREEKIEAPVLSFTLKVNDKIRMLIMPDPMNEAVGLLIKVMEEHEYEKINRQPKSWFAQQIQKTKEVAIHLPEIEEKTETPTVSMSLATADNIEFCNQHYLFLSEEQQKAKKQSLPLILSGAPGSGKSMLLLAKLKEMVLQNPHQKYLVLTESEPLIQALEEEWQSISEVEGITTSSVEFKTPNQLRGIKNKDNPSGFEVFKPWFVGHLKTKKERNLLNPRLAALVMEQEKVYAELKTMSGYDSLTEYNDKVPDSFYSHHQPERELVWDLCKEYGAYLETNPIDYIFEPIPKKALEGYLCLIDEAGDFSRAQLKSFGPNTLFCVGDHQNLFGSESIVPFIHDTYFKLSQALGKDIKVTHCPLSATFRCGEHIVAFINFLLELKYFCIGGKKNRNTKELEFVKAAEGMGKGKVIWLETQAELQPLIEDKDNADLAIVTHPAFLKEAQEKFGETRVFTPQQIKGLQYKTLLIYKMEHKEFETLKDSMQEFSKNAELASKPNIRQGFLFNAPFVCASRPQETLYLYFPDKKYHCLRELLKDFITQLEKGTPKESYQKTVSSSKDWQAREEHLRRQGLSEQADAINAKIILTAPSLGAFEHKDEVALRVSALTPASLRTLLSSNLGIPLLSRSTEAYPNVITELVKTKRQMLKDALQAVFNQINSGKATIEQSDYFVAVMEKFETTLGTLINPYKEFINKKIEENEVHLMRGNEGAVASFYRIKDLEEASPEAKLEYAISSSFISVIESLHREGVDFNKINISKNGRTYSILTFAILACKDLPQTIVKMLLHFGADPNEIGIHGPAIALAYSKWINSEEAVSMIFFPIIIALLHKRADPNLEFKSGTFILSATTNAIETDDPDMLKLFLCTNEDLVREKPRALLCAVVNRNQKILELLLEHWHRDLPMFTFTDLEAWYSQKQIKEIKDGFFEEWLDEQTHFSLIQFAYNLGYKELELSCLNYNKQHQMRLSQKDLKTLKYSLLDAAENIESLSYRIAELSLVEQLMQNPHLLASIVKEIGAKDKDRAKLLLLVENLKSYSEYQSLKQEIEEGMSQWTYEDKPLLKQEFNVLEAMKEDLQCRDNFLDEDKSRLKSLITNRQLGLLIPALGEAKLEKLEQLHEQGFDFNEIKISIDKIAYPILAYVFLNYKKNRLELIKTLVHLKANINAQSAQGSTLLYLAYQEKPYDEELIAQLLDLKADPNIRSENSDLFLEIIKAKDLKILQLFHQKNVNLKGIAPLLYSFIAGDQQIIEFLLKEVKVSLPIYCLQRADLSFVKSLQSKKVYSQICNLFDKKGNQYISNYPHLMLHDLGYFELAQVILDHTNPSEINIIQFIDERIELCPKKIKEILLHPKAIEQLLSKDLGSKKLGYPSCLLSANILLTALIEELYINPADKKKLDRLLKQMTHDSRLQALAELITRAIKDLEAQPKKTASPVEQPVSLHEQKPEGLVRNPGIPNLNPEHKDSHNTSKTYPAPDGFFQPPSTPLSPVIMHIDQSAKTRDINGK